MAAPGFHVTTEDLRRSSNVLNDKTSRYEAEYQKIYSEITNLRVQWQGQSSDSYNSQLEGYRNDFQELAKVLKDYSQFLVSTADKYEAVERKNTEDAQRLPKGK
jgi:WXG100 family type VII secretion target